MNSAHIWKFLRAGGFDQIRLETGADLMALDELDQKLWVALACPTNGLEFDSKTLAIIDTDKDGRIRVPEVLAAVKWAGGCLKNPGDLLLGAAELPLKAINDATPEGNRLLSSARHILVNLGKKDAEVITLEDTADTAKIFVQTHFNGDGIVPAESAEDEATRMAINEIIDCLGPDTDRSGKPGVSQAKVDQFFAEAQAYSDWWQKAESDPAILPLGEATIAAAAAFTAVKGKVEDYFTRCRLTAFDPRSTSALNRDEKDYLLFTAKDLNPLLPEVVALPLAQIGPYQPLPLNLGLNPAWEDAIVRFRNEVVWPALSEKMVLTISEWVSILAMFSAYENWVSIKTGALVEKLGRARVREILAGNSKQAIAELIVRDKALEPEANAIEAVEKLIRYYRDLYKLLNNFVSFRDFYSRKDKAIFQAGRLFLDQRSCDLCITVTDPGRHAIMAGLSGTYLAYCDCVRKGSGEQTQIVAAFTDGDSDNLMVGRNGIFYDRKGRDWDATIAKIVDNPISIRQAFWAPYKKAARLIQEQIAKRASAADQVAVAKLAEQAAKAGQAFETETAPAPPVKKVDPGLVAALSVGAAGIGGMIGGIVSSFLNLKWFMPLGVIAVMLIISGPSMLLAWLKLRGRNLGPILDANGWAVNAKAKINVPFGASLTRVAVLPSGALRDLVDPFAEKKRHWKLYLAILVAFALVLSWWQGCFDKMLPDYAKRPMVFGTNAPSSAGPAVSGTNVPSGK